jgi:hypothetical protein
MLRANPAELRKAAQTANVLVRAGVNFVCMPALDDADMASLRAESLRRIEQLADQAEQDAASCA